MAGFPVVASVTSSPNSIQRCRSVRVVAMALAVMLLARSPARGANFARSSGGGGGGSSDGVSGSNSSPRCRPVRVVVAAVVLLIRTPARCETFTRGSGGSDNAARVVAVVVPPPQESSHPATGTADPQLRRIF
mmetsp:Transcript_25317/g.43182  ORF Transcript_25317/g.43182 Transcript_25317/m.43182 type:complete len:133 (-) Transcript_25317:220-618(-)